VLQGQCNLNVSVKDNISLNVNGGKVELKYPMHSRKFNKSFKDIDRHFQRVYKRQYY
jgi:hypothetical protein